MRFVADKRLGDGTRLAPIAETALVWMQLAEWRSV
jgi:hypothetical protein